MIQLLIILGLAFGMETSSVAATWFVRPGVYDAFNGTTGQPIAGAGVYGKQDGSSYNDAFNGLTSVVWGPGGVNQGDTLFVCGFHCYSLTNYLNNGTQATTKIGVSGITIRMDWPTDPGSVFGGCFDRFSPASLWYGPDTNGVYWQSLRKLGLYRPQVFEIHGTNVTRLKQQTNTTWVGGLGSEYFLSSTNGATNFVKTLDGSMPTTNLAIDQCGWGFDLNRQSNITFQSCQFVSANAVAWASGGGIHYSKPNYTNGFIAENHIYWKNCSFFDGQGFTLYPGQDAWTFDTCEIGRAPFGIYTLIDLQTRGPNYVTITNCYIHDCDTAEYPNIDGHAVGIQGGCNCMIVGNRTERTGSGIVFWTGNVFMTNNLVAWNFVRDMHIRQDGSGGGDGICVSGDSTLAIAGLRIGNRILNNIILNAGTNATQTWEGRGIDCNNRDATDLLGNTIVSAYIGIALASTGSAAQGRVCNNIIANPITTYLSVTGVGASSNLLVDYNLFYPAVGQSGLVSVSPSQPHDAHSVFGNPAFVSTNPAVAADFRLSVASKAIGGGCPVGLQRDFIGGPIYSGRPPDIGAYEFGSELTPPTNLHILPTQ